MSKIIIWTILSSLSSVLLSSCAFAPVNNQYESAATLKKGNLDLAGSFTGYSVSGGLVSGSSNNNFGFRVGYGISDKFDLKFRYERLIPAKGFNSDFGGDGEINSINYFSIVPKIALIPEKLSLLVPVSHYSYKELINDEEVSANLNSITPQLIYTLNTSKNKVDFSFGLKGDCFFGEGGASLFMGTTAGAGFSTDLSKWAIRPEIGASFLGGGAFLSYGLGFQFTLPKDKKNNPGP